MTVNVCCDALCAKRTSGRKKGYCAVSFVDFSHTNDALMIVSTQAASVLRVQPHGSVLLLRPLPVYCQADHAPLSSLEWETLLIRASARSPILGLFRDAAFGLARSPSVDGAKRTMSEPISGCLASITQLHSASPSTGASSRITQGQHPRQDTV